MHIPDGYISPASAAAMYAAATPFWYVAGKKVKQLMSGQTVPLLAIFSAFSFTVMMFNIPVPGGTTAHAVGGTLAAIVLGPWEAVITVSVALVIQAFFFGDGGITAIGANCFNMAIVLPFVGYFVYRLIAANAPVISRRRLVAAGIGSYVGINISALFVALELGLQPVLWSDNGRALYSPYHWSQTIPAMLLVHLTVAGAAEVIATVFALAFIQRVHPYLLDRRIPNPATQSEAEAGTKPRRWLLPGIAALIILLVPLGLLASASAYGEWDAEEMQAKVGYVPSGLHEYQGVWSAPFSGYTTPLVPSNATFFQESVAYILSAVIGVAMIFVVVFALRILNRRLAREPHAFPA